MPKFYYTLPWNFNELLGRHDATDKMNGATQLHGGMSLGRPKTHYQLGLSHIISKHLAATYSFNWADKHQHALTVRHDVSRQLRLTTGVEAERR